MLRAAHRRGERAAAVECRQARPDRSRRVPAALTDDARGRPSPIREASGRPLRPDSQIWSLLLSPSAGPVSGLPQAARRALLLRANLLPCQAIAPARP